MTVQAEDAVPAAVPGAPGAVLRSVDPATGDVVAQFPVMDVEEVRVVVAHARTAAQWWSTRTPAERAGYLLRWAARLANHGDELADLLHREQGKPRDSALVELVPTLDHIRWAAQHAEKVLRRRRVPSGATMFNVKSWVEHQPYGVVGVIGPWNYPVFTPAGQMMAYALAAGNTVVLKPSEYTPALGRYVVDAFVDANPDVPQGVVGLVTGFGSTGAALCASGVDKIAFTGSTATGKRVLAACAENLVPTVMECGGKDAMIVAADADLKAAARAAAWGGLVNAGQTCVGIEQIYVVAEVRDRFLDALRGEVVGLRAGTSDDAPFGPMTVPAQVEVVRGHVADALASGATALVGGAESIRAPFVDPIVLVDAADDCSAVREETFGPVILVRTVSDVDEAVRLVNDRPFGLGASVFSAGSPAAIAQRVRAGQVALNCALSFIAVPALPFGGVGHSGFGRIHGSEGLREFSVTKGYAEQRFPVPGTVSLRSHPAATRMLRKVVRLKHGRAR